MAAQRFDVPPAMLSNDAEMSVLGAMLLSERSCEEARPILRSQDFYTPAHGLIYEAILAVLDKGQSVDLVTLRDELLLRKTLGDIGGHEYLVQLCEFVPSAANAVWYAERVREKSDLREMDRKLILAAKAVRSGDIVQGVMLSNDVTEGLYSRTNIVNPESVMQLAKKGLRGGVPHFMSEFGRFYDAGGFGPGLFHGYCAQSGKGKSTFLCQQAVYCLEFGLKVGIVSLEMTASDLVIKMLRQMTGFWSEGHAAKLGDEALAEYQTAFAKIRHWLDSGDLAVMDESDEGATPTQVFTWMNAQIKTNGTEVFFVDYVQDIQPEKGQRDDYSFHHQLSRRFKEWVKAAQVVLIGLFQIEFDNKEIKFKGGDRYRRDLASIIVKAYGKKDSDGHQDEFLVMFKNRYGRTGRVQVFYDDRRQIVTPWLS